MSALDELDEYLHQNEPSLMDLATKKINNNPFLSKTSIKEAYHRDLDEEVSNYIENLKISQRFRKKQFDAVKRLIDYEFDVEKDLDINLDIESNGLGSNGEDDDIAPSIKAKTLQDYGITTTAAGDVYNLDSNGNVIDGNNNNMNYESTTSSLFSLEEALVASTFSSLFASLAL